MTTTVAWSAPALPAVSLLQPGEIIADGVYVPTLIDQLELPEALGAVGRRHLSNTSSTSSSSIILVQDAHSSYEAQQNIKGILEHLSVQYDADLFFLEGGMGEIDPSLLEFFSDDEWNLRLADLFTRDGVIGGTELFLLNNSLKNKTSRKVEAYGVEKAELYRENLTDFRAVYDKKPQADQFLSRLKERILTAGSHIFNKKLKEFFREWLFHQDNPTELLRQLKTLEQTALAELGIDLSNPREQLDWPQLVRFHQIRVLESELDPEQANEQMDKLANWMKAHGVSDDLIAKIRQLDNGSRKSGDNNQRFEDHRGFLESLYTVLSEYDFSFAQYPDLSRRLGLRVLQSEIKAKDLFDELSLLTDKILETMAASPVEKTLVELYSDYLLLNSLFSLELVYEDHEQLVAKRAAVLPSAVWQRLNLLASSELREDAKAAPGAGTDAVFAEALSFYRGAKEREAAIFENMITKMRETGKSHAVLVAGGFHTEGLFKMFRDNAISYAEVSPQISEVEENSVYVDVMTLKGDYVTQRSYSRQPSVADAQGLLGLHDRVGNAVAANYAGLVHVNFTTLARQLAETGSVTYPELRAAAASSAVLAAHGMVYLPETGALVFAGETVEARDGSALAWAETGPALVSQAAVRSELRSAVDTIKQWFGVSPVTASRSKRPKMSLTPRFERLEDRTLLAGVVNVYDGDSLPDKIAEAQAGDTVLIHNDQSDLVFRGGFQLPEGVTLRTKKWENPVTLDVNSEDTQTLDLIKMGSSSQIVGNFLIRDSADDGVDTVIMVGVGIEGVRIEGVKVDERMEIFGNQTFVTHGQFGPVVIEGSNNVLDAATFEGNVTINGSDNTIQNSDGIVETGPAVTLVGGHNRLDNNIFHTQGPIIVNHYDPNSGQTVPVPLSGPVVEVTGSEPTDKNAGSNVLNGNTIYGWDGAKTGSGISKGVRFTYWTGPENTVTNTIIANVGQPLDTHSPYPVDVSYSLFTNDNFRTNTAVKPEPTFVFGDGVQTNVDPLFANPPVSFRLHHDSPAEEAGRDGRDLGALRELVSIEPSGTDVTRVTPIPGLAKRGVSLLATASAKEEGSEAGAVGFWDNRVVVRLFTKDEAGGITADNFGTTEIETSDISDAFENDVLVIGASGTHDSVIVEMVSANPVTGEENKGLIRINGLQADLQQTYDISLSDFEDQGVDLENFRILFFSYDDAAADYMLNAYPPSGESVLAFADNLTADDISVMQGGVLIDQGKVWPGEHAATRVQSEPERFDYTQLGEAAVVGIHSPDMDQIAQNYVVVRAHDFDGNSTSFRLEGVSGEEQILAIPNAFLEERGINTKKVYYVQYDAYASTISAVYDDEGNLDPASLIVRTDPPETDIIVNPDSQESADGHYRVTPDRFSPTTQLRLTDLELNTHKHFVNVNATGTNGSAVFFGEFSVTNDGIYMLAKERDLPGNVSHFDRYVLRYLAYENLPEAPESLGVRVQAGRSSIDSIDLGDTVALQREAVSSIGLVKGKSILSVTDNAGTTTLVDLATGEIVLPNYVFETVDLADGRQQLRVVDEISGASQTVFTTGGEEYGQTLTGTAVDPTQRYIFFDYNKYPRGSLSTPHLMIYDTVKQELVSPIDADTGEALDLNGEDAITGQGRSASSYRFVEDIAIIPTTRDPYTRYWSDGYFVKMTDDGVTIKKTGSISRTQYSAQERLIYFREFDLIGKATLNRAYNIDTGEITTATPPVTTSSVSGTIVQITNVAGDVLFEHDYSTEPAGTFPEGRPPIEDTRVVAGALIVNLTNNKIDVIPIRTDAKINRLDGISISAAEEWFYDPDRLHLTVLKDQFSQVFYTLYVNSLVTDNPDINEHVTEFTRIQVSGTDLSQVTDLPFQYIAPGVRFVTVKPVGSNTYVTSNRDYIKIDAEDSDQGGGPSFDSLTTGAVETHDLTGVSQIIVSILGTDEVARLELVDSQEKKHSVVLEGIKPNELQTAAIQLGEFADKIDLSQTRFQFLIDALPGRSQFVLGVGPDLAEPLTAAGDDYSVIVTGGSIITVPNRPELGTPNLRELGVAVRGNLMEGDENPVDLNYFETDNGTTIIHVPVANGREAVLFVEPGLDPTLPQNATVRTNIAEGRLSPDEAHLVTYRNISGSSNTDIISVTDTVTGEAAEYEVEFSESGVQEPPQPQYGQPGAERSAINNAYVVVSTLRLFNGESENILTAIPLQGQVAEPISVSIPVPTIAETGEVRGERLGYHFRAAEFISGTNTVIVTLDNDKRFRFNIDTAELSEIPPFKVVFDYPGTQQVIRVLDAKGEVQLEYGYDRGSFQSLPINGYRIVGSNLIVDLDNDTFDVFRIGTDEDPFNFDGISVSRAVVENGRLELTALETQRNSITYSINLNNPADFTETRHDFVEIAAAGTGMDQITELEYARDENGRLRTLTVRTTGSQTSARGYENTVVVDAHRSDEGGSAVFDDFTTSVIETIDLSGRDTITLGFAGTHSERRYELVSADENGVETKGSVIITGIEPGTIKVVTISLSAFAEQGVDLKRVRLPAGINVEDGREQFIDVVSSIGFGQFSTSDDEHIILVAGDRFYFYPKEPSADTPHSDNIYTAKLDEILGTEGIHVLGASISARTIDVSIDGSDVKKIIEIELVGQVKGYALLTERDGWERLRVLGPGKFNFDENRLLYFTPRSNDASGTLSVFDLETGETAEHFLFADDEGVPEELMTNGIHRTVVGTDYAVVTHVSSSQSIDFHTVTYDIINLNTGEESEIYERLPVDADLGGELFLSGTIFRQLDPITGDLTDSMVINHRNGRVTRIYPSINAIGAESNPSYAFRDVFIQGQGIGNNTVKLELIELETGRTQVLTTQTGYPRGGEITHVYDVSPDSFPGSPVVVYSVGGQEDPQNGRTFTTYVQRVDDPAERATVVSRRTQKPRALQDIEYVRDGENVGRVFVRHYVTFDLSFGSENAIFDRHVAAVTDSLIHVPGFAISQLYRDGDKVHVDGDTPLVLIVHDDYGPWPSNVKDVNALVFVSTGEGNDMHQLAAVNIVQGVTGDSIEAENTFLDATTAASSENRRVAVMGFNGENFTTSVLVNPTSGQAPLRLDVAITEELSRSGNVVTYATINQNDQVGEVHVNLHTLQVVKPGEPFTQSDLEALIRNDLLADQLIADIIPVATNSPLTVAARVGEQFSSGGETHLFVYSAVLDSDGNPKQLYSLERSYDRPVRGFTFDDTGNAFVLHLSNGPYPGAVEVYLVGNQEPSVSKVVPAIATTGNNVLVNIDDAAGPELSIDVYPNPTHEVPGGTLTVIDVSADSVNITDDRIHHLPDAIRTEMPATDSNSNFIIETRFKPSGSGSSANYYNVFTTGGESVAQFIKQHGISTYNGFINLAQDLPDAAADGSLLVMPSYHHRFYTGVFPTQRLQVVSTETGEEVRQIDLPAPGSTSENGVTTIHFIPGSSTRVIVRYANQQEEIYDVTTGELVSRRDVHDTNGDGIVSPIDALIIINRLNAAGPGIITDTTHNLDTNGDRNISPIDVLRVINYLNNRAAAAPEGETPVSVIKAEGEAGHVTIHYQSGFYEEFSGGTYQKIGEGESGGDIARSNPNFRIGTYEEGGDFYYSITNIQTGQVFPGPTNSGRRLTQISDASGGGAVGTFTAYNPPDVHHEGRYAVHGWESVVRTTRGIGDTTRFGNQFVILDQSIPVEDEANWVSVDLNDLVEGDHEGERDIIVRSVYFSSGTPNLIEVVYMDVSASEERRAFYTLQGERIASSVPADAIETSQSDYYYTITPGNNGEVLTVYHATGDGVESRIIAADSDIYDVIDVTPNGVVVYGLKSASSPVVELRDFNDPNRRLTLNRRGVLEDIVIDGANGDVILNARTHQGFRVNTEGPLQEIRRFDELPEGAEAVGVHDDSYKLLAREVSFVGASGTTYNTVPILSLLQPTDDGAYEGPVLIGVGSNALAIDGGTVGISLDGNTVIFPSSRTTTFTLNGIPHFGHHNLFVNARHLSNPAESAEFDIKDSTAHPAPDPIEAIFFGTTEAIVTTSEGLLRIDLDTLQLVPTHDGTVTIAPEATHEDINVIASEINVLDGINGVQLVSSDFTAESDSRRAPGAFDVTLNTAGRKFDFGGFEVVTAQTFGSQLVFGIETTTGIQSIIDGDGMVMVEIFDADGDSVRPKLTEVSETELIFNIDAATFAAANVDNFKGLVLVLEDGNIADGKDILATFRIHVRPQPLQVFEPSTVYTNRDITDFGATNQFVTLGTSVDSTIVSNDSQRGVLTGHVNPTSEFLDISGPNIDLVNTPSYAAQWAPDAAGTEVSINSLGRVVASFPGENYGASVTNEVNPPIKLEGIFRYVIGLKSSRNATYSLVLTTANSEYRFPAFNAVGGIGSLLYVAIPEGLRADEVTGFTISRIERTAASVLPTDETGDYAVSLEVSQLEFHQRVPPDRSALAGFAGFGMRNLKPVVEGGVVIIDVGADFGDTGTLEFIDFQADGQRQSVQFQLRGLDGELGTFAFPEAAFARVGITPADIDSAILIASLEHRGTQEGDAQLRLLARNPLDTNDDGIVSPIDALLIINYLNRSGPGLVTDTTENLDTNGDRIISPIDVLLVINYLNNRAATAPEGETPINVIKAEGEAGNITINYASGLSETFDGTTLAPIIEQEQIGFDAGRRHVEINPNTQTAEVTFTRPRRLRNILLRFENVSTERQPGDRVIGLNRADGTRYFGQLVQRFDRRGRLSYERVESGTEGSDYAITVKGRTAVIQYDSADDNITETYRVVSERHRPRTQAIHTFKNANREITTLYGKRHRLNIQGDLGETVSVRFSNRPNRGVAILTLGNGTRVTYDRVRLFPADRDVPEDLDVIHTYAGKNGDEYNVIGRFRRAKGPDGNRISSAEASSLIRSSADVADDVFSNFDGVGGLGSALDDIAADLALLRSRSELRSLRGVITTAVALAALSAVTKPATAEEGIYQIRDLRPAIVQIERKAPAVSAIGPSVGADDQIRIIKPIITFDDEKPAQPDYPRVDLINDKKGRPRVVKIVDGRAVPVGPPDPGVVDLTEFELLDLVELGLVETHLARFDRSLVPTIAVARMSEDLLDLAFHADRILLQALINIVAPEIMEAKTDQVAVANAMQDWSNVFEQLIADRKFLNDGNGIVVSTTAGDLAKRKAVTLAKLPLMAAVAKRDTRGKYNQRFVIGGENAQAIHDTVFSRGNALTAIVKAFSGMVRWGQEGESLADLISDAIVEESRSAQPGSVISSVTAGEADAMPHVITQVLRMIQDESELTALDLLNPEQIADFAAADFARDLMLQDFSSREQVDPERLKTDPDYADGIAQLLKQYIAANYPDIDLSQVNIKGGRFHISLQEISKQLTVLRDAMDARARAA